LTDGDIEVGSAMEVVNPAQLRVADGTHRLAFVDRENDLAAFAALLVPRLFGLAGHRLESDSGAGDLEVVDPLQVERQQIAPNRPEGDLLAGNIDDGLLLALWGGLH